MGRPWMGGRTGETAGRGISLEGLALLASLFFALACNSLFMRGMLAGYDLAQPATWGLAVSLLVGLAAIHFCLLGLVLTRWLAKPLLAVLIVATAFAVHYMNRYNVYLDTSMLRNVLATDPREVRDLLTWSLLPSLLFWAVLPLFALFRLRLKTRTWGKALAWRLGSLLLAVGVLAAAIFLNFQDLASAMRNNRELRFLVTPANYIYSLGQLARSEAKAAQQPRQVIGGDAQAGPAWAATAGKPVVMVMVLGETVRAANWGLSGYSRQTTPELAKQPGLINFAAVSSCGTNTETSLPCLFSPWGRRQYDEARIRGSQSLLDVVARAGFRVVWVDNQSGCKGVCDGVESLRPDPARSPQLCAGGECFDGALLTSLQNIVEATPGNLLIVLHQMGNHGPAYFKRAPEDFKPFQPACADPDLPRCSAESIVNAYDNAIYYTDHVLAGILGYLRTHPAHESGFVYVSDHGESLGERGIYLHGLPYSIAPDDQTQVPLTMWLSDGLAGRLQLDAACLRQRATQPAHHDHLFHSLLGLLDVRTALYEPAMDLTAACRPGQR